MYYREQTVEFTFQRLFQAPTLPNVLQHTPIISRLSGAQQAIHYDAKLHLNPDGSGKKSDEAPMMLVTKMDIDRREKAPLENLVWGFFHSLLLSSGTCTDKHLFGQSVFPLAPASQCRFKCHCFHRFYCRSPSIHAWRFDLDHNRMHQSIRALVV